MTKSAAAYTAAIANATMVAGTRDRKWNGRFIAALAAAGLTMSLVTRRGEQYPNRISEPTSAPVGQGPIRWVPVDKVYIVWADELAAREAEYFGGR